MPCNSDYLDPTQSEIHLDRIYHLLDELETGKLSKDYGTGFDERAYQKATKTHMDNKASELCSKLQKVDVKKYSLEMQIWWRDHQKADKIRISEEKKEVRDAKLREKALAKLTPAERKALGID